MTGRRSILLCLCLSFMYRSSATRSEPVKSDPAPRKDRHALLVAVTNYENLPESKHLKGPANDAELLHKLLVEKLQFSPDRITVLSEKAGKAKGADYLPTKNNIEREFARLAGVAKPGDQVLIHLGGRGGQQPEQPGTPLPNPDGLVDTFLPRDVGRWDGIKVIVENAILLNDVGSWLRVIRDTRASVWITFDLCHSGIMLRMGDEVIRDVEMTSDLAIPRKVIDRALAAAAKRIPGDPAIAILAGPGLPAGARLAFAAERGIVAIHAAQPNEVTIERELSLRNDDGTVHGLLTYTMVKVLTEALEKSKEPITYNELMRRIQAQYVAWGRTFPTPRLEGADGDRAILGGRAWPGHSLFVLSSKNGLKVNAGAINGLTEGCILSVQPPPGQGDKRLGFVRIDDVRRFDSDVEPCDEAGKTARTTFPEGALCQYCSLSISAISDSWRPSTRTTRRARRSQRSCGRSWPTV